MPHVDIFLKCALSNKISKEVKEKRTGQKENVNCYNDNKGPRRSHRKF